MYHLTLGKLEFTPMMTVDGTAETSVFVENNGLRPNSPVVYHLTLGKLEFTLMMAVDGTAETSVSGENNGLRPNNPGMNTSQH